VVALRIDMQRHVAVVIPIEQLRGRHGAHEAAPPPQPCEQPAVALQQSRHALPPKEAARQPLRQPSGQYAAAAEKRQCVKQRLSVRSDEVSGHTGDWPPREQQCVSGIEQLLLVPGKERAAAA
jgi:hypothetical protein